MATNILRQVSQDEEARAYYESELIFELDQRGRIRHALEEERITLAKNLLDVLHIDVIIEKFNLTAVEIKALKGD